MPVILHPRQQQHIIQQFLAQSRRQSAKPITLPHYANNNEKTAAFHAARQTKIRSLFGGDRSGKSEAGGFELVDLARQFPGHLFWAAAMTYPKLKINAEKIFKYLAPEEIQDIAWANRALRIPALIRHVNGSTIEFKTYNSGVGAFASDSVKGAWLDEDPQRAVPNGEEIFVECLQRTIDCQGLIWITATPVLGKNWMFRRIYEKAPSSDVKCWTMSLLENRFVSDAEKERARALLTADEIERRFYGLFTVLEGAVFKELLPDLHFIPRFPIPADWRKARAIDLGYNAPFCCLWGALSPDNELYVYAEHYQAERLLSEHAEAIRQIDSDRTLYADLARYTPIENTVSDHARQERAELETYGIYSDPADKDVDLSIQIINRLLKPSPVTGKAALYVFNDLAYLPKEMQSYRYAPQKPGQAMKETPLKVDDHSVDALRYLVMYFYGDTFDLAPLESAGRFDFPI